MILNLMRRRSAMEWCSSLPVFAMLLLTLVIGTGEMVHGQMLRMGEALFGDAPAQVQYFMLRAAPQKPACNPHPDPDAAAAAPAASASADDIDALFADRKVDPQQARQAMEQSLLLCREQHAVYAQLLQHQSLPVKVFRTVETGFFSLFHFGTENRPLILLLVVAVSTVTATLGHHHIGIRPARHTRDRRLQAMAQALAMGLLLASCISYWRVLATSGGLGEHAPVYATWIVFAAVMFAINLWRSVVPPRAAEGEGRWRSALLTVPLYAFMGSVAGLYFLLHGHTSGLAIYVNQLMELPTIFLNLALFIWAGMLLKQSRVVDLFMDVLRPWRMSPQLLTYIVLLAASVPTAYTGASGIFVVAAGAVVYHEVRAAGGTRQFALAATAMSGSLGVVLRPCLLVVLIAALNKQVTTTSLYYWGFFVFLLTSTLFFLASQALRTQRAQIETLGVAVPGMLRALLPTLPHVALVVVVVAFYEFALNTHLNEVSAPTIMPVLMLLGLALDKYLGRGKTHVAPDYAAHRQPGLERSIRFATTEAIGHIGALLFLMTLSLAMGGVIERSEVMNQFPKVFDNHWTAMAFLVVMKVLLGTFMDPFGAVVLVSGTLAPVAFANHIDPAHFWMMVLVAFELGYLLPPIGLNQLLTRQVVGEAEIDDADHEVRHAGFFKRYERWILPMAVMSVSLAVVAFAPLAVQDFESLAFIKGWFASPQP